MTSLRSLREQIERIDPVDQREADSIVATLARLDGPGDPFSRFENGHLTASAFVVSSRGIILHRHLLLGIWIQPGGHVDTGESPEDAALRETFEETGLTAHHFDPVELFHVDVHPGPHGHRGPIDHLHYDLRYALWAQPLDPTPPDGESPDVEWFDFDTAQSRCEPALAPVIAKLARWYQGVTCENELVSETEDLRALMEADRWIERVNTQKSHLPETAELAALELELRAQLKTLNESQAALTPVRSAYDESQREGERLRARAASLDKTLSASTANARELAALQHELQHVRELLEHNDDLELEYLVAVEPLEEAVSAVKAAAQPAVARRSALKSAIAELQASLDDELVALREQRSERAVALSPELLTRYEAAFARVGTSGAAQVVSGHCDGCRIALSPLDVDRWKGQPEGSFMTCPECGRLLLP